jgi:putative ABC transport system permease protein
VKALDILEYAFSDYTSNKFKTMMSSLGIIIGVMAIVVMLTLGDGLQAGVSQQFGSLDLDTMTVLPMSINLGMGSGSNTGITSVQKPPATFTDRDVSLLANTPGVAAVYPEISASANGAYKGINRSLSITGILPQYETDLANDMDYGRFLSQTDKYSVVLGSKVANGTYGKVIRTGSYITLTNQYTGKSQDYVVVGVLKERNTSIMTGDPNSAVYMTKAGLKGISDQETYTSISIRADNVQTVDTTATNVEDALSRLHRNEAYSVITQKTFSSMISTVFNMIKYVLAGISAVSLVVGGIGIMNVMMLTVKERVKEIGLMKAVGATTTDVRLIFMMESALLGVISGLIGVIIAAIVAMIVGNLVGLSMSVSVQNISMGVLFGLLITTVFGVYPANQASKLDPIEALRTE